MSIGNVQGHATGIARTQIAGVDLAAIKAAGLNTNAVKNMVIDAMGAKLKELVATNQADLPQFIKDATNDDIDTGLNGLKKEVSFEVQEFANNNTVAQKIVDDLVNGLTEEIGTSLAAAVGDISTVGNKVGLKSNSWLLILAKVLGEIADKKLDDMMTAADNLSTAEENSTDKNQQFAGLSAQVTAASKIFSIAMETAVNVIKTTGDGITSAARK